MTTSLPPDASLTWLRKAAKTLRDRVRHGEAAALALVHAHHPRYAAPSADAAAPAARATPAPWPAFALSDAQLTIARSYGFASWPRLVAHLALAGTLTRSPHRAAEASSDNAPEELLLRLGCLTFGAGDADRPARGMALLTAHPALAGANQFTAAATGDQAALAAMLTVDPGAANREGGPFGWPPLLYLAYSRLVSLAPGHDPVTTARLLLEAGADPNAGFLWSGLVPPFTVVTGVIGRGEQGAPPHRDQIALLELLLEAGADANDGQAAYNCGLGNARPTDDTDWLETLLAHGLGRPGQGPWYARLGPTLAQPPDIIGELLQDAAARGLIRRARVLLAAGADPDRGGRHPLQRDRSPYADAVAHGHPQIAALLERAGATAAGVPELEHVVGLVLAGEPVSAEDADRARAHRPDLVRLAAELGKPPALLARLVELGWDVNARRRTTALHEAALRGDAELVLTLLRLGADPRIADTDYGATAAGWAAHAGHEHIEALLGRAD